MWRQGHPCTLSVLAWHCPAVALIHKRWSTGGLLVPTNSSQNPHQNSAKTVVAGPLSPLLTIPKSHRQPYWERRQVGGYPLPHGLIDTPLLIH